ncbi:MAG: hypothetical protein RQ936_12210 [Gammaproteobacteria bacterium]|nr:hypothetical protein [Gammaproteobacteria bacterium]
MVRAGVVSHPSEWRWSGYREIQTPGQRYTVINNAALHELFNIHSFKQFQTSHQAWIEAELETTTHARAPMWSQSLAIGHKGFVENVQTALGFNANHRNISETEDAYALREPTQSYTADFKSEKACLSAENLYYWTELLI